MKHITWIAPVLLAAALAGCGGSDDPAPVAASEAVPEAANQGDRGLVAWIMALMSEDTEAKEPLGLSNFGPQTADDTEPQTLQ